MAHSPPINPDIPDILARIQNQIAENAAPVDNFLAVDNSAAMQHKEFASLTSCSIGRGAVAPSQTLPKGLLPTATTKTDRNTVTEKT